MQDIIWTPVVWTLCILRPAIHYAACHFIVLGQREGEIPDMCIFTIMHVYMYILCKEEQRT